MQGKRAGTPTALPLERQASEVPPALSSADRVASEIDSPLQWIAHNTHFVKAAFAELQDLLRDYAAVVEPEARAELARLAQERDLSYLTEHVPVALGRTLEGLQRIAAVVLALRELARRGSSRPGALAEVDSAVHGSDG